MFIDHLVVQPVNDVLHDFLQVFEVEQQASFVELRPSQRDPHFVIMPGAGSRTFPCNCAGSDLQRTNLRL